VKRRKLDFLRLALDAEEVTRVPSADGSIGHAEARICDAIVMLFDAHQRRNDGAAVSAAVLGVGHVVDADERSRCWA
jgi:uncharacterized glyoxalase superfamily protein PhnB